MTKNLSVITVVFNGESSIIPTLVSIKNQKRLMEYIVIDGGSQDGTLYILQKWAELIDSLIIEKDEGIYDAMNKGANLAMGEWLFFLNSGDILYSESVLNDLLVDVPENVDVVYGDVYLKQSERLKRQSENPHSFLFKNMICHQSFAVRKRTLIELGGFDTRYRIFADKDFLLKALGCGFKFLYKPICVAIYDETGISSSLRWVGLLEHIKVLSKYYSIINILLIIFPLWIISCLKRSFRQNLCH
jgi:glycosyltransferase involved in cell wall biosynthesis